jgi:hypothetical protein
MSASSALSALLDDFEDSRRIFRGDPAIAGFITAVDAGIAEWENAVAAIDAGGDAAAGLDAVSTLFALDEAAVAELRTAEDMVRLRVGTASHRLLVGLVGVRKELVKENALVVAMLRRAVVLGKRSESKWRGSFGRQSAQVDRDLTLEELRVAVRTFVRDLRGLLDLLREQTRLA